MEIKLNIHEDNMDRTPDKLVMEEDRDQPGYLAVFFESQRHHVKMISIDALYSAVKTFYETQEK